MRAALPIAIAAALASPDVRADPTPWIDDATTTLVTTVDADATIAVRERAMSYASGYRWVQLDAVVTRAGQRTTTRLFGPGPTMCATARAIRGGIESATCTERFGDTRAVVRWQLGPDDHLVAASTVEDSPYAQAAARLIARTRAVARTQAALARDRDRLGDTPDGQQAIAWWWAAHDLLARWPAIDARRGDDPDGARADLAPLIARALAPDDDGEPGVRAAIAFGDLRFVPRTRRPRRAPIDGPRPDLTGALVAAHALLRAGSADDFALADRLCPAILAGATDAVIAALPSAP